jgi:CheY-like chemotaxis protein
MSLGPAPATVMGDPVRLQQIFGNLLNNSMKYTPVDGSIWIELRVEDGRAVVTVTDNGPGIPADKLETVFDLFVQANPTLARTEGGLGIGLTLVKQLVELHGGDVTAAIAGPLGGTRFTVRLPIATGAETPSAAPAPPPPPARAQRVLVVEDSDDGREMLAALLRMLGHEVFEASTGAAAIEQARRHAPSVVIMDIGLPDIDGYEVAGRLRRRMGADVRLVALSGYGQPQDRARAREAGFDEHLVKPVDPTTLGEVIQGPA